MTQLKFAFSVDLPLRESPADIVALTALLPRGGQRATAFGWLRRQADGPLADERYWVAQLGPEGALCRVLPASLTQRLVALCGRSSSTDGSDQQVQAFAYGEGLGLLLGVREVHLYPDPQGEPSILSIDNDCGPAQPGKSRGDWFPQHLGHAAGHRIPVVLRAPFNSYQEGRHLAVLNLDVAAGRALWTGLDDAQGGLAALHDGDYTGFPALPGGSQPAGAPLILDCGWLDGRWLVYAGGQSAAYHRFGLAPSVLSLHRADLRLERTVFQAGEESFGRLCAAGDRIILTPLRRTGPARGKQSVRALADGRELAVKLPRGYTKHSLVEYCAGCYWLLPMPWGYAHGPLVACVEA